MVTVQGQTLDLEGQIIPNQKVTIQLVDEDGIYTTAAIDGKIRTQIAIVTSDANGDFTAELFPNDLITQKFTKYKVSAIGTPSFYFYLQDTTSIVNIEELVSDFPIIIPELPGAKGDKGDTGDAGLSIDHVSLTATNGLVKTYTAWLDAGETLSVGTFDVTDGTDGTDGIDGAQGIQGIQGIAGQGIDHVSLYEVLNGVKEYRVWGDAGETILFGSFTVIDDSAIVADIEDNTNSINSVIEAIANLASAQGQIVNAVTPSISPIPVTPTKTTLDFTELVASTDTTVFEFDDVANTITFKKIGSYNFNSSVTLESSTGLSRTITFDLVDTLDESIVVTQPATVEVPSGKKANFPLNTLVIVDTVPLTIRIDASADGTGYALDSFDSVLVSMINVIAELPTDILRDGDIGVKVNAFEDKTIIAEDNAIDFTKKNFELTATAANITATGLTGTFPKEGTILIHSAENITGWGVEFKFKNVPIDLTGDETFGYFAEDATNIWIGRVQ